MAAREVVIAGFGGQGVLSMGMLLTHAGMHEGHQVSWMPSYGPEQRGGTANCCVVISSEPVASPVVTDPELCVVMNLPSLKKFEDRVRPGGTLLVNSSLIPEPPDREDITVYLLPANQLAESIGDPRTANMVMLGALVESSAIVSLESISWSLREVLPEKKHHLIAVNERALELGASRVRS